MKMQPFQKKHWGWRIRDHAAAFSLDEALSVSVIEDLAEHLHVTLTGRRNSNGKPKISIKVSRNVPEDIVIDEHIVYGSLEFHFDVYFSGITLSEIELDNVMKLVMNMIKKRRAK